MLSHHPWADWGSSPARSSKSRDFRLRLKGGHVCVWLNTTAVVSDCWWRGIFFCRRALLRTGVSASFLPIARGCAAMGCQLKKLLFVCRICVTLTTQVAQSWSLPPRSFDLWLWGHDDWEWGNARYWIEIPEAWMSGAVNCHTACTVCWRVIISTGADVKIKVVLRICMYEVLQRRNARCRRLLTRFVSVGRDSSERRRRYDIGKSYRIRRYASKDQYSSGLLGS